MPHPPSILFLNRVFPPQEGATGWLLHELAEALARDGASVTIVTSALASSASIADKPVETTGVRLERVWVLGFSRASHLKRAFSYISLYPALLLRALGLPRHDVVVTMTDPPLHLLLGPIIGWLKGSKVIHWAQDVYPELAEELGVIGKRSIPAKILRGLSTWALKRHHRIIAVGRCMTDRLIARGIPADKIIVIPNWAQSTSSSSTPSHSSLVTGHSFPPPCSSVHSPLVTNHFAIMYSGNLGLAHDFTSIVAAIEELETRLPQAKFIFIGGGARLLWLKEQLKRRTNVEYRPSESKENLQATLSSADLHLVCMREDLCGLVVPSKIYGALAAGRPSIFVGPAQSEAALVLKEHEAGIVVSPHDPTALTAAILKYANDPALRVQHGRNASDAAEANNFKSALAAFRQVFDAITPERVKR